MSRIAVDVVLLPSSEMIEHCITFNEALRRVVPSSMILGMSDCIPHISLAMGCIEEADLFNFSLVLQKVAREFPPLLFTIEEIATHVGFCGFVITRNTLLQSLHEQVMNRCSSYFFESVEKHMFYNPDEVDDITVEWVKNFCENSSFEKFSPHITLGCSGPLRGFLSRFQFVAPMLAVCHLGSYGTCRTILFQETLSGVAE